MGHRVHEGQDVLTVHSKNIFSVPGDLAGCGFDQGGQHPHEGGFTCTVDTQQTINTTVHLIAEIADSFEGFVSYLLNPTTMQIAGEAFETAVKNAQAAVK